MDDKLWHSQEVAEIATLPTLDEARAKLWVYCRHHSKNY